MKLRKVSALVMLALFQTQPTYLEAAENSEQEQNQVAETEAEKKKQADENLIVVTGSRIRRQNEDAAIPVQVLNRQDINEIGSVDIGEVLAEIPGVEQALSPENTSLSTQNNALSTISLRRLGSKRTLTLIDGRRAVSNSGNGERVNLQTIPAGFVDRVEVTTGGASAIYGTDAIAGVANIILRDNWVGTEVNVRNSQAEANGENEKTFDFTFGTDFNDGRGHTLFAVSYDKESAVFADSSRPFSIANIQWDSPARSRLVGFEEDPSAFGSELGLEGCNEIIGTDEDGDPIRNYCFTNGGSSFLPGGRFEADDAWNIGGVWYNDASLLPDDGRLGSFGFETHVDGYNYRPGRTLSPEVELISIGSKNEYYINQSTNVFADISYSKTESMRRNAAANASFGTDIGSSALAQFYADNNPDFDYIFDSTLGFISSTNPFIPPEVEETRSGSVSWYRRFNEVGMREVHNERETLRTSVGFEGFTDSDWEWELAASFGDFSQRQVYKNELNYLNMRSALEVESDGNGGYQCQDSVARDNGCIPLNLFGEGSITTEMANYIRYTGLLEQDRQQTVINGSMNGDLWELDSGSVKAAFGFEYRKEEQDTVGDPDNVLEYTSITHVPNIKADFDVAEVYGELDIPVIKDTLSLQLAARYADYSTVGSVLSYNVGGSWRPNDSFRLRGQYSRSQRAPTITEFYSAPRPDYDPLRDPCDGLMPDGTGIESPNGTSIDPSIIAANCLAQPGIQAFFANPDNAGEAFEFNGSVFAPNSGNLNLFEETADTYTIGAIITPASIEDLSLIVDYYKITVDDVMSAIPTQLLADICYSDPNGTDNQFCLPITRDSDTGYITQVINRQENLNKTTVEGFDVDFNYSFDLDFIPGRFNYSLIYSNYLTDETEFNGLEGIEVSNSLGEINNSKQEFRSRLRWSNKNWLVTHSARFRSGGVDNNLVDSSQPEYFRVGSQTFHNVYLRYKMSQDPRVSIYGGINNLLDDHGPILPVGLDYGSSRNFASSLNHVVGREFYLGFRFKW